MPIFSRGQDALKALEVKLKTILPSQYQDTYEDVKPVSMGSAPLKYGKDSKVAWDEMWGSFCDLAMAGGPPHKGKLLLPGTKAEIETQPERYQGVVEEILRGIALVTELPAKPSPIPGWIRIECENPTMAGWLLRAIVMENVSARCESSWLDLPAGPAYRLEKEIKNVITVVAKTCHYFIDHMWESEQQQVSNLFASMAKQAPLIEPALVDTPDQAISLQVLGEKMAAAIFNNTGLASTSHAYPMWLGVECGQVRAAIWMMRAMVVSNVLARREETVLFLPVNPQSDPDGERVVRSLILIHGFARTRKVL